jgi:lipopolysaccharide export LptBFGC system permease protein LptF
MKRSAMWIAILGVCSTAAVSAQQVPSGEQAKDKMICKRTTETGSLVAKRRECRTRYDWDRISEAARMKSQELIDRGLTTPQG